MKNGNAEFQAALHHEVGTLLNLWSWDGEGAGHMGTWMVGAFTLWDVTDYVPGDRPPKNRDPSKIYGSLARHEIAGSFRGLPRGAQGRILAMLRKKSAEKGCLAKELRRLVTCAT
jgi:hypothetical protein